MSFDYMIEFAVNQTLPSRQDLKSFYLETAKFQDLNTKATALSLLGHAYFERYRNMSQTADLEKAISISKEGLQYTSLSHPKLGEYSARAGDALDAQFDHTGDPDVINKAVSHYETAVRVTDDSDESKARYLSDLGSGLFRRFERLGSVDDIKGAITFQQKAVELISNDDPDMPSRLRSLGASLQRRFEHVGNLTDVESAIEVSREGLQLTSDGHPDKPLLLNCLGDSLLDRFSRSGSVADMESAIAANQMAIKLTPDGHPDRPFPLISLGNSLLCRFEQLGHLADVESAVALYQKAVAVTPDGHPDKPSRLNNLGNSLLCRFDRLGNLADVDSAIAANQTAVDITLDRHPGKPCCLSSLGNSLQSRFERLGNLADIDNAIIVQQEALDIAPVGHPDKPLLARSLANAFLSRFERRNNLANIESAVAAYHTAVEATPNGHTDKAAHLSGLGNALVYRSDYSGNHADVDRAIKVHEMAVELIANGHPDEPSILNNLGNSFYRRFERLKNRPDIDSAITAYQKAVETTPDGHPDRPGRLHGLGNAFYSRFKFITGFNDLENSLQSYSRAASSPIGPTRVRFIAARAWATAANENSRSPLLAFRCAIDLLPRIAWVGIMPADQHALLADIGDVVRDAVAAAIKLGEYKTAVEWAEQGRSIVWQNLLGLRSPVDDLRVINPELANRLQSAARQLESPVSQRVVSNKIPTKPVEDVVRSYSQLGTEWDNIVAEIRQIPNFQGFLGPKSFSKLAPAISEGPIVILNVHKSQSAALVLVPDESNTHIPSVLCIPLESSTYSVSKVLSENMSRLLSSAGLRSRDSYNHESTQPSTPENPPSFETYKGRFEDLKEDLSLPRASERVINNPAHAKLNLHTILGLLWLVVVKPILDGLGFSAQPVNPPRIWWCATGPLAFLPVHAAGIYKSGRTGHIISDYVVSSYTPTIAAILDQSQPVIQPGFQLLTVAVPAPKGATRIPGTEAEVTAIQNLAKANRVHYVHLTKETATLKQVSQAMKESNWIHLACHGQQSDTNAMESGFLLQDGTLDLSEMVKLSLPKVDFAFLSACQTATGDEKVAEESVHLAAGMLLLGCRGVIATMWSISDNDAPQVAEDVYRQILKDGLPKRKEAFYALHGAVKQLRESGADFLSWVPFIHIGR